MSGSASSSSYEPYARAMPTWSAAACALSSDLDAIASTRHRCDFPMPGITFVSPILAVLSTPIRNMPIPLSSANPLVRSVSDTAGAGSAQAGHVAAARGAVSDTEGWRSRSCRLQHHQQVAGVDAVAGGEADLGDHGRAVGGDLVLHLHRLDDHQQGAVVHALAGRHVDGDHGAG